MITWRLCSDPHENTDTMVHELGHALGLGHEDRRCSVMNYARMAACGVRSIDRWRYHCRWIEADDVRGLVALYGGRPRFPTGPRLCTRGPAPAPVEGLGATTSSDGFSNSVTLTWTNPQRTSATGVGVLFKAGSCPTGPADVEQFGRHELQHAPGPASVTQSQLPLGTICALVQAFDRWGQPSPAATTTFEVG